MTDTIAIICDRCDLQVDTPRCESDPPDAVQLRGIVCSNCDTGGFDMPEYYDASGELVSGDPATFETVETKGASDL